MGTASTAYRYLGIPLCIVAGMFLDNQTEKLELTAKRNFRHQVLIKDVVTSIG